MEDSGDEVEASAPSDKPTVHAIFLVAYLGRDFLGWQQQSPPTVPTVQLAFRKALQLAFHGKMTDDVDRWPPCRCASRLDAGVSTEGLLVHASIPLSSPPALSSSPRALLAAVNSYLPPTVVVRRVLLMPPRTLYLSKITLSKTYSYYLRVGPFPCENLEELKDLTFFCSMGGRSLPTDSTMTAEASMPTATTAEASMPTARRVSSRDRWILDAPAFAAKVEAALKGIVGEHDFAAFSVHRGARSSHPGSTVREVLSVSVRVCPPEDLLDRVRRIQEDRAAFPDLLKLRHPDKRPRHSRAPPATLIRVDVTLKGALMHMVRMLMHCAVLEAAGTWAPGTLQGHLATSGEARLRSAPAAPLWLTAVQVSVPLWESEAAATVHEV
jgi:tRNA pseudouridine(38-40) synthase